MRWDERQRKYWIAAAVLLLAMAAIYFYTHRNSGQGNPQPAAPLVRLETLSLRDMKRRVVLSGETVARASVDISPKYAGRIASVEVELGDVVRPGEVLIRQDVRDVAVSILQNHAQSAEASAEAVVARASHGADLLKARTNFETAKATYERYQKLYDAGAVALQERDEKYRAMTEAQAVLAALEDQQLGEVSAAVAAKEAAAAKAEYMVEALEIQREDLALKSPVAGVVGYRKAEAGEWATAGETLLTVVDNSRLYFDCLVAEQDIGVLREGMETEISLSSVGKTVKGKILYVAPSPEENARAYRVRLLLADAASLRAGLFGRAEIEGTMRTKAIFVPKEAVSNENGKTYVYVISADGVAQKRAVRTGLSNDEAIELLSGVTAGERVAVTNASRLSDGIRVQIDG